MAAEGCLVVSHASLAAMQQMNSRLDGGDSTTTTSRGNPADSTANARNNHEIAAVTMSMHVTDESACSDPSLANNNLQKDTADSSNLSEPTMNKLLRRRNSRDMNLSNSNDSAEPTSSSSSDEEEREKKAQHEELLGEEDFEVALSWNRNNRVLQRRLEETAPKGKLSMVRFAIIKLSLNLFVKVPTHSFLSLIDQFVKERYFGWRSRSIA